MGVVIKEVVSKNDLRAFVHFPHALYKKNPYWVPALVKDELITFNQRLNPAFENCEAKFWLAYKNGELAGRIAGIINSEFLKKWKVSYARFGWMDFVDDHEVSQALLETVENWAEVHQMKAVHGPLGFTDFDPEGLLLEGFDKQGVMTTIYNYPYYVDHLLVNKYIKDAVWVEFEVEVPVFVPERIKRMASLLRERYKLEAVKAAHSSDMLPYARDVFSLINESYSHLYGVVYLNERQIDFYLDQFFSFIDPDFCSIIINDENNVVAFAIAMPSLSKALKQSGGKIFPFGWFYFYQAFRRNNLADLYLIAVHPTLQHKGVSGLIIEDLIGKFKKHKIKKAITHPILEYNRAMVNFWKQFEKKAIRKRGCFIKSLTSTVPSELVRV